MLLAEGTSVSDEPVADVEAVPDADEVDAVDDDDDDEPLDPVVPLVPDVDEPFAAASESVTNGATNAMERTSTAILRSRARASCDRSISSRPLVVSFHD